tara:strand:+ start:590 stop:778 length:189 start_codon:yes stop_codon:yes gene_type:complete
MTKQIEYNEYIFRLNLMLRYRKEGKLEVASLIESAIYNDKYSSEYRGRGNKAWKRRRALYGR